MRLALPTLTLTLITLGVAACGGSTDGGSNATTAAPIARKDFAAAMVDAYCAPLETCCEKGGLPHHRSSCESLVRLLYPATTFENEAEVDYDPVAAGACVDELARSRATCVEAQGSPPACGRAMTGKIPPGGDCSSTLACTVPAGGRAVCHAASGNAMGKCVPVPRGTVKAPCFGSCRMSGSTEDTCNSIPVAGNGTQSECYRSDGLYCSNGTSKCAPLMPLGSACVDSWGCVAGAACVEGVCATQPNLGGACGEDVPCAEGYCDLPTRQCRMKQTDGAKCLIHEECTSGRCNLDEGGKTATCGQPMLATKERCK